MARNPIPLGALPPPELGEQGACIPKHRLGPKGAKAATDRFYPDRGENSKTAKLNYCHVCPVQTLCLEWALANGEKGIWGGKSERERRAMRRLTGQRTLAQLGAKGRAA